MIRSTATITVRENIIALIQTQVEESPFPKTELGAALDVAQDLNFRTLFG